MEKTFNSCYQAFMEHPEDRLLTNDGSVIRKYFQGIDWSLEENQQAFLEKRHTLDSLNTQIWTIEFWVMWGKYETELLKNKTFLIQYLKTADRNSSAIYEPQLLRVFTRNADMSVLIENLDEFTKEVGPGLIGMIFKFGYPFAPGLNLNLLYAEATKDPHLGFMF